MTNVERIAARSRIAEISPVPASATDWLQIVSGEFHEIPGLHLTKLQVQRLWGLDVLTCEALLDALVEARSLQRTEDGAYVRADTAQ
jgi:hypothetical protein